MNNIKKICKIEELNKLKFLQLFNNRIEEIEIETESLIELDLKANLIEIIDIKKCKNLQKLEISGNRIKEIKGLKELKELKEFDCGMNFLKGFFF
jgi:Leucine-rich repeat (LRR) protein